MSMSDSLVEVVNERGRRQFFKPETHRALVAVGLSGRTGTHWRCDATRTDMYHWPEFAICDFCSDQPVTWAIDAETFMVMPGFESFEGWMACEPCGLAIYGNDRATLASRSFAFIRREARYLDECLAVQQVFLSKFWDHYRGIRRYVTPYADAEAR